MIAVLHDDALALSTLPAADPTPQLADGQVLLCFADLEEVLRRVDVRELTEPEQYRAAGFSRATRRREFVGGRCLLRRLIAMQEGVDPAKISCVAEGAPVLGGSALGFHCSIAHRKGKVTVAIGRLCAVGVDVEEVRLDRTQALENLLMDPSPASDVCADRLYAGWCECEALAKLTGRPLPAVLAEWRAVTLRHGLPSSAPGVRIHSGVCIHHVVPSPGWRIALALEARTARQGPVLVADR